MNTYYVGDTDLRTFHALIYLILQGLCEMDMIICLQMGKLRHLVFEGLPKFPQLGRGRFGFTQAAQF